MGEKSSGNRSGCIVCALIILSAFLCLMVIGGISECVDRRRPAPPPIKVDPEEIRQRREAAAERAREEVAATLRRVDEEFEASRPAREAAVAGARGGTRPQSAPPRWCAEAEAASRRHMRLSFLKIRIDCTGEERPLVGPRGIQPGTALAETLAERGLVEQMEILGYARTRLIYQQGMMDYCTEQMTSATTAQLGRDFIRSCFDDMVEYRELAYAVTDRAWEALWGGDREATIAAVDSWLRVVGWLVVPPGKLQGYPGDAVFRMVETPLVR